MRAQPHTLLKFKFEFEYDISHYARRKKQYVQNRFPDRKRTGVDKKNAQETAHVVQ